MGTFSRADRLAPPSDDVQSLLDLIPDRIGFRFVGLPDLPHLHPDNLYDWTPDNPSVIKSRYSDLVYPNDQYPEDRVITVTNRKGEKVDYPYHQDAEGKRYFLSAHIWYKQKDHVLAALNAVATSDPLGAARLLYRWAQIYAGYVPTNEYPWHTQPVEPASTPPHYWWGGMWYRWSAGELSNFRPLSEAYALIADTNAFEELSAEVGEDTRNKVVHEMFLPSIVYHRSFSVLYHNMEYHNARGLASLGKALKDPSYIHEVVEWAELYARNTYLFDGFFEETTLSYHMQSTNGLATVIADVRGWTDPAAYVSPRNGTRLDNLDLTDRVPVLGSAMRIPELLVYPDGKYFPTQDTWAVSTSPNPDWTAGSFLLPAAGMARFARGAAGTEGGDQAQLYLTFSPKYGHHHFDPLDLVMYANGQELLPDIGYTHTMYRWRTLSTLGHNTVTVDADDALASGAAEHGGNVEVFAPFDDTVQVVRAHHPAAYAQTSRYSREAWLIRFPDAANNEGYVLDLFRVVGGNRHEYALQGDANRDAVVETGLPLADYGPYLLPAGVTVTEPTRETEKGEAEGHYYGYIFVRNVKWGELADGRYDVTFSTQDETGPKARLRVIGLVEAGPNELFVGDSPSMRATRLYGTSKDINDEAIKYAHPKVVVRREGNDLASNFITALEPHASDALPRIDDVRRLTPDQARDGDLAVQVDYGTTSDIVLSSLDPAEPMVVGDITMRAKHGLIRLVDGAVQSMYLVGGTLLKKGTAELTDAGPVTGVVTAVERRGAGADRDAFHTTTTVPTALAGRTVVVTHPDGKTHGYKIAAIEDGGTAIRIDEMDPGFVVNDDGSSALEFYPFTSWTGETTFRIENVAASA